MPGKDVTKVGILAEVGHFQGGTADKKFRFAWFYHELLEATGDDGSIAHTVRNGNKPRFPAMFHCVTSVSSIDAAAMLHCM